MVGPVGVYLGSQNRTGPSDYTENHRDSRGTTLNRDLEAFKEGSSTTLGKEEVQVGNQLSPFVSLTPSPPLMGPRRVVRPHVSS